MPDGWRQQAPKADGSFVNALNWNFIDDKLKLDTNDVANYNDNDGSASAVLPVCCVSTESSLTSQCRGVF